MFSASAAPPPELLISGHKCKVTESTLKVRPLQAGLGQSSAAGTQSRPVNLSKNESLYFSPDRNGNLTSANSQGQNKVKPVKANFFHSLLSFLLISHLSTLQTGARKDVPL